MIESEIAKGRLKGAGSIITSRAFNALTRLTRITGNAERSKGCDAHHSAGFELVLQIGPYACDKRQGLIYHGIPGRLI